MSITVVKNLADLDDGYILAPERYDPRRETLTASDAPGSVLLDDVIIIVAETISGKKSQGQYLVLDTSNANEGIVSTRKPIVDETGIGSTKKLVKAGDVIISRLRPYLRQVAFVDDAIPGLTGNVQLACSTEFFVLRSKTKESIAYLVPYLLSDRVQSVLAASQEGGHHPRFNGSSLLSLPVPKAAYARREQSSKSVASSVKKYRMCESKMQELVVEVNQGFSH